MGAATVTLYSIAVQVDATGETIVVGVTGERDIAQYMAEGLQNHIAPAVGVRTVIILDDRGNQVWP
jgi:hypothetical protein